MTKALVKGYAMGAATMSSLVILFAYLLEYARLTGIAFHDLNDIIVNLIIPANAVAIFFGAAMPFLFSALTLRAVNEGAFKVIEEIRRQFNIPGVLEGKTDPEYAHVVDLTTANALKSMISPTLVTVLVPIILGFLLGPLPLAVYLISVTASSATLASTQFNSGGALDNAKKIVEEGLYGGKGTDTHAAVVIGDTFGDPLKDTAGPSLHILVKLQNIMSITLLPLFIRFGLNLFQ
ncbi:MAG: sodium/proton-translocating pyrophosphatase [Anaerolineales bacterium]